jgi:hypothetical protein
MTPVDFEQWLQAAEILNTAWHNHGRLMHDTELNAAYWSGFDDGEQATHQQYQTWLGVARAHLDQPTQTQLEHARAYTTDPCPSECGKCSACIHASAVKRNLTKHGTPDYMGGPAEWE